MKLWEGEDLSGQALWVRAEQGLGDEILFASMLDDLAAADAAVVWEADARLIPLLRRSQYGFRNWPRFVERGHVPEMVDFYCPAGNLGRYLRRSATDFPHHHNGYLRPSMQRKIDFWRSTPGTAAVGVSWRSSNAKVGDRKSIPLDQWVPIFSIPGTTFVDMQYGDTAAERAGRPIHHVDGLDLTNDIDGLAALIWACEAVVTVSNTVAHLAGALGVPVHVLVPSNIGRFWCWGHEGEKSLWYPTATIHRQVGSDWGPAIRGVVERLGA